MEVKAYLKCMLLAKSKLGVIDIIFVTTANLKPGMTLAMDLNLSARKSNTAYMLTRGQRLSEAYIERISSLNLGGVFIEDPRHGNTLLKEKADTSDEALKARALCDIEQVFSSLKSNDFFLEDVYVEKLSTLAQDLVRNVLINANFTMNLFDLKSYDDYTFQHSLSVAVLSIATGIKLTLSRSMLNDLAMSALLHDVGKIEIPIDIINKAGALTNAEFDIVKQHPQNAVKSLRDKEQISDTIIDAVESHHEKHNGTGYPYGKKGQEISLFGKILAICDVYDALSSDRPYRKRWFPGDVIEHMMAGSDVHFDQAVLSAFLKSIAVYPVGSRVLLSNGEKAIVTKNYAECILRPIVRIVSPDGSLDNFINLLHDLDCTNITIVGIDNVNSK